MGSGGIDRGCLGKDQTEAIGKREGEIDSLGKVLRPMVDRTSTRQVFEYANECLKQWRLWGKVGDMRYRNGCVS